MGRERFEAPECLFNPLLLEVESLGVCELLFESLNESPIDTQRDLVNNVILTGGTTMFPGLSSRVEKDLQDIYVREKFNGDRSGLKRISINVRDPPRRRHGVFIGASFLANFAGPEAWVTKKDYEEKGSRAFQRR